MLSYLAIDFLIVLFPLLFTFYKKIAYYRNFKPLFISIFIVGGCYIVWDAVATYRGDWWFNHEYVMDFELLGLPLEEILFFITVPYSCTFIYEALQYFIKDRELLVDVTLFFIPSILFIIAGVIFYDQYYTVTVLFSCSLFFSIAVILFPQMLRSGIYWLYILIAFIPFFIINYLLTSIPIVLYNSQAIWNVRITTIPSEDFFYNFSLLSFYLIVYLFFKARFQQDLKPSTASP
jgi:lycopene cyclase domain-containing protein